MTSFEAWTTAVRSAGFVGAVHGDAATRAVYGTDNSIYQLRPLGAVVPTSVDDLSALAAANHGSEAPLALVARGGGTGTNGQSLTDGVVVDLRRSMNHIVDIDVEARTAVVQPGVVLGELNARLAPHGLFFAPHVSTASRATIGGMVSTDAAGKGSLVHGRTNDHVLSVRGVLDDGEQWDFARMDAATLASLTRRSDRIGVLHRMAAEAISGLDRTVFPDVPRGFTGYNLVGAQPSSSDLDLAKLLCGSEGTLALIGEVTIRLTPLPTDIHLAVVSYESFAEALRASTRLTATSPIAIECLDERTIALATGSPAWPTLNSLVRIGGGALLLIEYEGVDGIESLRDHLSADPLPVDVAVTTDRDVIAAVWKVRSDAVGFLGQSVGGRRSVAFVEDCAVPPRHLEAFVGAFREVLDRHDVSYGMFGHADVGCVHVRPALDLFDPHHEALVRTITDEVAALVSGFGGVLWGEHGRGVRGEYLDLPEHTVHRMRLVKTAFDPRNLLNPGKLYAPFDAPGTNAWPMVYRIDEVPLRVHSDRVVPAHQRTHFDSAFACNGNGVCHHWGDAEMMCPSYKVTADPRLSPKGRADLLRAWLHAGEAGDGELAAELAADLSDSMATCLSCGACTGRCPIRVDIPEMKSKFLERQPESGRRRLRTAVLARFESSLPAAQRHARLLAVARRCADPIIERVLGITDLPGVPPRTVDHRAVAAGASTMVPVGRTRDTARDATVVILPDAFTAMLDPAVLEATLSVLDALGERVAVAPFVPSGKLLHVKGRRRSFATAVAAQRRQIESLSRADVELVVVEPAVALLYDHEYRSIDPDFPVGAVTSLSTFLAPRLERLREVTTAAIDAGDVDAPAQVRLFGHCTEVSLRPEATAVHVETLQAVGWEVAVESTSCCGMAGVFGHEIEHREMSSALFELGWRPRLAAASESGARCAAVGYSCRSQARRFGHLDVVHPIQLVAEALR